MGLCLLWISRVQVVPSAQLCTHSVSPDWCSPHTGSVLCQQDPKDESGHNEGHAYFGKALADQVCSLRQAASTSAALSSEPAGFP